MPNMRMGQTLFCSWAIGLNIEQPPAQEDFTRFRSSTGSTFWGFCGSSALLGQQWQTHQPPEASALLQREREGKLLPHDRLQAS